MSIVLNSKTYNYAGWNQNQQASYSETSGGIPASFSFLTAKVNVGTGKAASSVKWNLSLPIVAESNTDCACAGEVLRNYRFRIEVDIPAGSSSAERADILARLQQLTAKTEFTSSITGLVQPAS